MTNNNDPSKNSRPPETFGTVGDGPFDRNISLGNTGSEEEEDVICTEDECVNDCQTCP